MSDQIRLLVVEDVPQVAQYIRGLLNSQSVIKLLDVVTDGSRVAETVASLRPDVLIVDHLLTGRVKAKAVLEQLRQSGSPVSVIMLTVPQHPVSVDAEAGIAGVVSMPFTAYELVSTIQKVHEASAAAAAAGSSSMITVFAPKGGVGRTTLAFNLAVAIGQLGRRTVLVDGSMQFGDLRSLLNVPAEAPSILDLPTDRISESDLGDVLWRDPSGIDIMLAPPRIEMAEMVSLRDVEKMLSLVRRVYEVLIVDTPATINDLTLAFLDACNTILEIVTYDSTTIRNTTVMADTFRMIGYPASKVRYLVNRADSPGGIGREELAEALGREPEYLVASGGTLVVNANNDGIPFILADPSAPVSQDIMRIATDLAGLGLVAAGRR